MADDDGPSLGDHVAETKRETSKSGKGRGAASAVASGLSSMGKDETDRAEKIGENIHAVAYKRGGKVRKTGPAIVHRGERVIPASKRKKAERLMKRGGMSLTNKTRKSRGR